MRIVQNRAFPLVGQLNLVDSGLTDQPTVYAGAVCVRGRQTPGSRSDSSHISLDLIVAAEPKIRCQEYFSARIDKAVDDKGQELVAAEDPMANAFLLNYGRRNGLPY